MYHGQVFGMNRHNHRQRQSVDFPIFGMTTILGNKKEALVFKDFNHQLRGINFRHTAKSLTQSLGVLLVLFFAVKVDLQNKAPTLLAT